VALSMVLLVGAGLFLRSLQAARSFEPGFKIDGVLLASLDFFSAGYDEPRSVALQQRLLERVRGLPEVTAATLARRVPLSFGGSSSLNGLRIEGYTPPPKEDAWSYVNLVGPDYFRTLGVPLRGGRDVADGDGPDAPRVVVVNQTMARRYWAGRDPLGGRVTFEGRDHTVVGVVSDFTFRQLGEPAAPYMFLPLAQYPAGGATLHVRVAGDPLRLAPALREAVRELDPALPLFGVRTLRETSRAVTFQHRLGGTLLGAFGALALGLAAVGLGGVLAYMVGQRTREIGVRMALGGNRGDIFRLVLRRGLGLTVLGMALGLAAALALTRPLGGLLFGVGPGDPATVLAVVLLLGSAALVACVIPARRAMRVDPLVALRHE
jgi:macrolide transport system ATP-binding/permease protein